MSVRGDITAIKEILNNVLNIMHQLTVFVERLEKRLDAIDRKENDQ